MVTTDGKGHDSAPEGDTVGPLLRLRVVEFASFVAVPSAGMTLAQLGAEVIRIDPIGGGSDLHRWPLAPTGTSLYWTALNKGKRSVTVNTRSEEGRELIMALVAAGGPEAGIFLDNTVGRERILYESLRARRPDAIHMHVVGNRDGTPAVDYTVNAAVGVPGITGPETASGPVNHAMPLWDLLTGATAAVGLMAAVYERQLTGSGAYIELALGDVAMSGVANLGWLADVELNGVDRMRLGNHVYGSFGVDFGTADGERVMVVALTEKQWHALCLVTGTADVFSALEKALSADLDDEAERYRLRETIAAILRPWFSARTLAEVAAELDTAHVLWGPYRSVRQLAEHLRGAVDSVIGTVEQPGVGKVMAARSPLRWSGGSAPAKPAPTLGADTAEVLSTVLGINDAELGRLANHGVIRLAVGG